MSTHDVLVLAEIQRGALTDVTLELLSAARGITAATGGDVMALVLSGDGTPYVPSLAAADRLVLLNGPQWAAYAPEPYLAAIQEVIASEQPRAVLIAGTSIGWDLAPMLSARLDVPFVGGCEAIDVQGDGLLATSSFCGGKMLAKVRVDTFPAILMILPGSFRPTQQRGKAQVESRTGPPPTDAGAIWFQELVLPESSDVDITQQEILVAVGRGIQQKDNVELAEELAAALGGAVCASRPVVDQGWLPSTRQVGKSGMTVKPKVYLAFGVSGAPEHQEGMKAADLIIAVNTDPKAPIFEIAHYGAEIDALELLPALVEAAQAKKG